MSSEGIGEPLLVLPPLGPNASREPDMDRKLGELATKNWGMRKEDSSVYALWWREGRVSPESDLIEGGMRTERGET